MSLYEGVWSYIMLYDCIGKHMDENEAIWRYMKVYQRIWM